MLQQSDRQNDVEQIKRRDFINNNFRFKGIKTAPDTTGLYKVGLLYFFKDEVIADAFYRKVMYFNEACSVIIYSSHIPLRSGKSNDALQMALDVDPDFDVETQLYFTGKDFLSAIKETKTGQALIWDEAGVGGGSSKEWRSQLNQDLGKMMRLAQFRKPFLFFVCPDPYLLETSVRILCGIEMETVGVNQGASESYAVCRTIHWKRNKYGNLIEDHALPRRVDWDGSIEKITTTSFPDTSNKYPDIWKKYEKRKSEFLYDWEENSMTELKERDKEAIYRLHTVENWPTEKIAGLYDISQRQVERIIKERRQSDI